MGWLGCIVDEDDPQNYEKWKPKRDSLDEKRKTVSGYNRDRGYKTN